MLVPQTLQWLEQCKSGRAWLAELPRLVSELTCAWNLEIGPPFDGSNVSFVAPVVQNGSELVLKVQWPHDECLHEADALQVWNGSGAIKLIAHDSRRHALLLERCRPGDTLAASRNADPIEVLTALLPKLWKPASKPFKHLANEARGWSDELSASWDTAKVRCDRRLIDTASDFIDMLADTQGEQVLVHQDLHGDNILSAQREPWLAIDPKPLLAEREFSLAPIIRSFEFGHSRAAVIERLDRLSERLNIDRERARRWAIAQTVAWSFDSSLAVHHYETVDWLMDAA